MQLLKIVINDLAQSIQAQQIRIFSYQTSLISFEIL